MVDKLGQTAHGIPRYIPDPSVPQHVRFLACLCGTGNLKKYLLVLCCFPSHLNTVVRRDVDEHHKVVFHGEGTSISPLNVEDQAFFCLPNTFTLCHQGAAENTFLK